MPDSQGNVRGISVGRLYPGHRDYEPPAAASLKCCKGDDISIACITCPEPPLMQITDGPE